MLTILLIYLGIGLLWSIYVLFISHNDLKGWLDYSIGFFLNLILWPMMIVLACAVNKLTGGMGGH